MANLGPMAIDVTEATFHSDVLDASTRVPVVVDFWAQWCGPCRTLGPVLEKAAAAREGDLVLAKVDVDTNAALGPRYGVKGIPAVKAFRDGQIASEFVGAKPPAEVEAFMDALLPSPAARLAEAGDEASLRESLALEPGRADAAMPLAKMLRARGDEEEALEVLGSVEGSFEVDGIAARIELSGAAPESITGAVKALDEDRLEEGTEALLEAVPAADTDRREQIRRIIVGALAELGPEDPRGREYRRRLAALLY